MAVLTRVVDRAPHPYNFRDVYVVVVLEVALHPHRGAHGVDRQSYPLAFEVLRGVDARAPVDGAHTVSEHARWKHRQGNQGRLAVGFSRDELRGGHFGEIELEISGHAIEDLACTRRTIHGNKIQGDAVRLHVPTIEIEHAIVEAARHRQFQL